MEKKIGSTYRPSLVEFELMLTGLRSVDERTGAEL